MDTQQTIPVLSGSDFSERFQSLFQTGLYSDLILLNTDPVTKEVSKFNVHKCILAINSPVWETSIKWISGNVLEITGFSKEIMQFLLAFAYQGIYDFPTLEFCLDVFTAADFYNIPNLSIHCVTFIKKIFSETNISPWELVLVFNKASAYKITNLIDICFGYIQDHISEFLSSREFRYLSKEAIALFGMSDKYFCKEHEIVKAILEWTRINVSGNMRQFLKENNILKTLRFRTMKNNKISEFMAQYPDILNAEDEFAIMNVPIYDDNSQNSDIFPIILPRGSENQDLGNEVIVGCPPFVIVEKFRFEEVPTSFVINSIHLDAGLNLSVPSFTKSYEESLTICIHGILLEFDDVVDRSKGIIVDAPDPVSVTPVDSIIKIEITLNRPGVYKKNSFFSETDSNMFRIRRGLIKKFCLNQIDDEDSL